MRISCCLDANRRNARLPPQTVALVSVAKLGQFLHLGREAIGRIPGISNFTNIGVHARTLREIAKVCYASASYSEKPFCATFQNTVRWKYHRAKGNAYVGTDPTAPARYFHLQLSAYVLSPESQV